MLIFFCICARQSLERGGGPQAEHAGLRRPARRSGVAAGGARPSGGQRGTNNFASGDRGVGGGGAKNTQRLSDIQNPLLSDHQSAKPRANKFLGNDPSGARLGAVRMHHFDSISSGKMGS